MKFPQNGFKNYWFDSSGTSSIIMNYLKIKDSFNILNYQNRIIRKTIKELSAKFEITNIPYEILLYQTGFLTIRKESNQTVRLVFPNTEIEDSVLDFYFIANNIRLSEKVQHNIDELAENIDQKNLINIINIFNNILNECAPILSNIFQDERAVRDIIYAALPQEISLQKIKERETVQGFSDLEILTKKTHMIIEFKRTRSNRNADATLREAIEQLKSKKYGIGAFTNLKIYRVAMVISSEAKMILSNFSKEIM